nr:probable histone-lysine N-methyltransferase PRDM7 [Rhipicephalus microplus]
MSQEEILRKVRCYFNDEEWAEMPEITKERYANIKRNYDAMIGLGLKPAMPEFMKAKPVSPKPAKPRVASTENSSSEFRYPRRQRNEVNYMECEEGADEEYLFCDDCNMDYPGDCPVHGPLTHVKDTPVPLGDPQRANKTVPDGLLVRRSTIKGAQYGVFTIKQLSKRLCFGPYEGVTVDSSCANGYTWQIRHGGRVYLVDGRPLDRSNWMRYVNCAPQQSQQNLLAFVRQGAVYYRTNRVVYPGEELFVWYGDAFAKQLGLIGKSATASAQNKQGAKEFVFIFFCTLNETSVVLF